MSGLREPARRGRVGELGLQTRRRELGNFSVAFYTTFLVKIVIMNFLFDHPFASS